MKKILHIISIITLSHFANAQITITQADLPQAGDAFIITNAMVDLTIDPEETGANHAWDFQNLALLSSSADSFIAESGLPAIYQLFFFGANLADKTGYNVTFSQFTLEDVYNVYKSSSSTFEQYGYAGTLDGIPIPIVYDSKDVIYNFPLQYGDEDSSESNFTFDLPGLAYISQQRKRVNTVDGWGTVATPVGLFDALRIKSTITDVDSVYIDSLNYGVNVSLISYEYKWLSQGKGTPVFQINAQDLLGVPVVTQMLYQDTTFHTGVHEISSASENIISVSPIPANGLLQIQFHENIKYPVHLVATNLSGEIVYEGEIHQSNSLINVSEWYNGIYFLHLEEDGIVYHSKVVIQH